MRMFFLGVLSLAAIPVAIVFVRSLPDLKRYMRMRAM